jgi:transglutaminase-like putative cysteine protease
MDTKKFATIVLSSAMAWGATAQVATSTVNADFEKRVKQVNNADYFSIFKRQLSQQQIDALKVLYAYMPLPDLTDYSADYYLENVDYALKARDEMPWGKKVSDQDFRYFVLPVRVNNESLDGHRKEFYEELKDRVKGLSMYDAILEINHWCHEKATYQPSDSRTHSPLATCYTAIGRCGEESTFTVAALRAMGIPARQIYTPRWAHTDDNHAWVEAWADGTWYFLGACEPEPVLNLGWFNAPASRGMLMTTRVFGNYEGKEEVLGRVDGYTSINVTSNYAPVDTITVTVVGNDGKVVENADVSFRVYNYAEFYSLANKKTDKKGTASLSTGLGDLLVWATNGSDFGFAKASVGKDHNIILSMNKTPNGTYSDDMDIIPPVQSNELVQVTDEQNAHNNERKAAEDAIRNKYTSTFITKDKALETAASLGVDGERLAAVLNDARGNHQVLVDFLKSVKASDRDRALCMLEAISTKDRSDVPLNILKDHINAPIVKTSLYNEYVLSPRIDVEFLSEYRAYFIAKYKKQADKFRKNPALLVNEVSKNITIVPDWYPPTVRMSPVNVDKSKVTNAYSRNVYFVAIARSLGIPSRVDPVTAKTQYADAKGNWVDAKFENNESNVTAAGQGNLVLNFVQSGRIDDPKYYSHFTLSKIVNGEPQLYEYPEDGTWSGIFKNGTTLDEGQYILVTGQRMANGGVLAHTEIFQVKNGETVTKDLKLRQDDKAIQVIGNFNAEDLYHDAATNTDKSIISTTGRGYYVLGLLTPNQEPTNHALRDIAALNADFENWGKSLVLLFKDSKEASRFDASQLPALPSTVTYGTDIDGKIAAELTEALNLTSTERPLFIIADTFNRIVFMSQGYTIGLGEQMIDIIHRLSE